MSIAGPWRGWYAYAEHGAHHPMEMRLTQKGEAVVGAGMGDIGISCLWPDGARPGAVEEEARAKPKPRKAGRAA